LLQHRLVTTRKQISPALFVVSELWLEYKTNSSLKHNKNRNFQQLINRKKHPKTGML